MNLKIHYSSHIINFRSNFRIIRDNEGSFLQAIYEKPTPFSEAFDELIKNDDFCSECDKRQFYAKEKREIASKELNNSEKMQGVKIKSLQGIGMDAFAFENEDGDILKITYTDHFKGRTPDVFDLPVKQKGRVIPDGFFYYYIEDKVSQDNITQKELKDFVRKIERLGYSMWDHKNSDVNLPFISINTCQFGKTKEGKLYLIDPGCVFKEASGLSLKSFFAKILSRISFFVR